MPLGSEDPSATASIRPVFETLASILAPIGVITALLYYFGWVRSGSYFGYFGLDQRILGLSSQDYLVRSANVAFRPILVLLAVSAAGLWAHAFMTRSIGRPWMNSLSLRRLTIVLRWLVIALLILTALSVDDYVPRMIGAIALGGASTIGGYTAWLSSRQTADASDEAEGGTGLSPSLHGVLVLALSGLLFSLFWATALYAQRDGQRLAEYTSRYTNSLPAVEIYSTRRLQIIGPGVTVRDLELDNLAAYRFHYSGLRLLISSSDRWILIPEGWSRTNRASVIILRDSNEDIRLELHP